MKTLDQICIHHGTDKASIHPHIGHDYARQYDKLFTPLRAEPVKMLEIGVGGGESIRSWLEYFANPGTRIYGVDRVKDTNPFNTVGGYLQQGEGGKYTFVNGDQSHDVFWKCFIADYGAHWDIIIDDGSHINGDVITSFNELWPYVKPGGFYAVEDLGVAYGVGSVFIKDGFKNHMDWLREKQDEVNQSPHPAIDSIYFSQQLAVFRKAL